MITIEVPGTVPAPPVNKGVYAGLGVFSILLAAVIAWVAAHSGDPSLWTLPPVLILVMGAFLGSNLLTLVGRERRIRLVRRKGCWASLGSRTGQLLYATAWTLTLLITTVTIIALPDAHPWVWLIGLFSIFGVVESVLRLREPVGWYFDEHMVMVTLLNRGSTAFTWDEVEGVELRRRGVHVTGLGRTVKVNGAETASDPAVVVRVIEFYRTNARSRSELSDERFLERLRSGQL